MTKLRISLESNAGSGKTHILNHLEVRGLRPIPENREGWDPWITKFYNDPTRWCYTTHSKILLDLGFVPKSTFVERSPWSVMNVFVRRYRDIGYITEEEYRLLYQLYNVTGWEPDVIIYIKVPPKDCYLRICEKYGTETPPITLRDLEENERYYEEALRYATQPVIRVDGGRQVDINDVVKRIQKKLDQLEASF